MQAAKVDMRPLFVVAMVAGAFLSSRLKGDSPNKAQRVMPEVWRKRFGGNPVKRNVATFIAGFIVLYGARLAGGCTSGHMMSGMMQSALSGYLFSIGVFLVGIPLAIFVFNKKS
jgi:hypothetical protein